MRPSRTNERSPLDQIRQAEAEVTRQIAAAREAAQMILTNARLEAAASIEAAQEAGRKEGQAQYRDLVTRSQEEAQVLLAQAHRQVGELRRHGERRMDTAILHAVHTVLGYVTREEIDEH